MMRYVLALIILIVFINGCSHSYERFTSPTEISYSDLDYDELSSGVNSAFIFNAFDKDSGQSLNGHGWYDSSFSSGSVSEGELKLLSEKISDFSVTFDVNGYATYAGKFKAVKNKTLIINAYLEKTNEPGLRCYDVVRLTASNDEVESKLDDAYKHVANRMSALGFEDTSYVFENLECYVGRGGWIKGNGTYKGDSFSVYSKTGFCSSSGNACGYIKCVASENMGVVDSAKENICPELNSFSRESNYFQGDGLSINVVQDNSNQTRKECLSGAYDQTFGNMYSFSVIQNSGRDDHNVKRGSADCYEFAKVT